MNINNIKNIDKNSIIASATVVYDGEVKINDIAVLKNAEDKTYFDLPGDTYKDKDGNWKKNPYAVPVSPEAHAKLLEAVQEALDTNQIREAKSEKRPQLLGFTDVRIDGKYVSVRTTFVNTKDGHLIATTPSKKVEKDGNVNYYPYIKITKEQGEAAVAAYTAQKNEE